MSTIFDQYTEQRRKLAEAYIQPTRITFSSVGRDKMLRELASDTLHVLARQGVNEANTYQGLPYLVDHAQQEDIKLHNAMADYKPRGVVSFRVDHLDPHQTTMEVAGQALTKPQLCDIINAWCEANPKEKLAAALDEDVRRYGSFE